MPPPRAIFYAQETAHYYTQHMNNTKSNNGQPSRNGINTWKQPGLQLPVVVEEGPDLLLNRQVPLTTVHRTDKLSCQASTGQTEATLTSYYREEEWEENLLILHGLHLRQVILRRLHCKDFKSERKGCMASIFLPELRHQN